MKGKLCKVTSVLVILLMFTSAFTGCGSNNKKETEKVTKKQNEQGNKGTSKTGASIDGVQNVSIKELTEFDPLEGVTAKDADGKDVSADIEVTGEVNALKEGEYELTYKLKGTDLSVDRVVTVTGIEAVFANGKYNYKFASSELRHTFMAAAEDYLLHNMYAGIPLYSDSGYRLFSNRMQLFCEEYLPVMGFGTAISSMSADDSKVLMEDGKKGKAGEYTYRVALSGNPTQWNPWKYDDSVTADVMGWYLDSLYNFEFNEDKTGYVVVPSMASEDPIAVEGRELPSGKVISKKWQIKIKDGLTWKFNENTDTSMLTDKTINAVDFYETYKLALEEKWFRATSILADGTTAIVNAQKFVDGAAKWDEVGIKLIDDNTLQFEFVDEQSTWNTKYNFASFVMTPINIELYNALGEEKYGIDENSIAYHGAYYVDYYESDKIIRLKKNEDFHDSNKYFYTGMNITIIKDAEMRFQEFVAGKLDNIALPATQYEEYKSHPGLKREPGATTTRLNLNCLGTKEGQIEQFPESEWVPEPILANKDFRMGMYHSIDRQKLAEEVMKTYTRQMYLFTDAYLVDADKGVAYRNTPQGMAVGSDLSPATAGYNLDAAKAYFEKALDALVSEGVYKNGDEITIELYHKSASETAALMGTYLKDAFETAFNNEKYNIKVKVELAPKDFPGIYYDHQMIGEFDTAAGGIQGVTLDAPAFLDCFSSDNRGGFTLNWGIDTSVPEITVSYVNDDGEKVKELWSFDAIYSVLTGDVEVKDGAEVKAE